MKRKLLKRNIDIQIDPSSVNREEIQQYKDKITNPDVQFIECIRNSKQTPNLSISPDVSYPDMSNDTQLISFINNEFEQENFSQVTISNHSIDMSETVLEPSKVEDNLSISFIDDPNNAISIDTIDFNSLFP